MSVLPPGIVGGLAEVVLRVQDLDTMQAFYGEILGLPFWRRFGDDMVFFKLPPTVGGRPQAVALFADRWPSNAAAHAWAGLDQRAQRSTTLRSPWGWRICALRRCSWDRPASRPPSGFSRGSAGRSATLQDPEGNVVELVADDPSVLDPGAA